MLYLLLRAFTVVYVLLREVHCTLLPYLLLREVSLYCICYFERLHCIVSATQMGFTVLYVLLTGVSLCCICYSELSL